MHVPDIEQSEEPKCIVTPLVAGWHEGTDEARDDENNAHEHDSEDVGGDEPSEEEELKEQQGEGNKPLNVSNELYRGISLLVANCLC